MIDKGDWEKECLSFASKIVRKHGGLAEGGHLIDRLIFLDKKLTEYKNELAISNSYKDLTESGGIVDAP